MRTRVTRILVPIDFSSGSQAALRFAEGLARQSGAALHLLTVIEEPAITGLWPDTYATALPVIRDSMTAAATERLSKLAASCGDLPVTTEVVLGYPAPAIVRLAKTRGFDLIVMGTHGRAGLPRVLLGSVAERVLRTAHCPVLTVRMGRRILRTPAENSPRPATPPTHRPRRSARAAAAQRLPSRRAS